MKLFQRLLVAPAALGLLAPMMANANEVNFNAISNYSDTEEFVENLEYANSFNDNSESNTLIAGGEGMVDDHNHGSDSFSSTTTASFSVDMAFGATDGVDGEEAVTATYGYQIDLNTSFTGEDSLDVSIDAGTSGQALLDELDLNSGGDKLTVDGLSYTFPLGDKTTVFVGDNMDGSTLYNTACVYGGPTNTLDDCGNASSALQVGLGTAAGASYDIGNGFTAAIGYETQGSGTTGVLSKESADAFGGQLTYIADSYGTSVTYAKIESTTTAGVVVAGEDVTYWGLNGYWTPSESGSIPSLSVGYEMGDPEKSGEKDTTHYFLGLQWDEVGPGTFGAAIGTTAHIAENATETLMYEAFYSYPVNDGMTITPIFFIKETSGSGTDTTGMMVKSSFSF
jgi:hypothetical protein